MENLHCTEIKNRNGWAAEFAKAVEENGMDKRDIPTLPTPEMEKFATDWFLGKLKTETPFRIKRLAYAIETLKIENQFVLKKLAKTCLEREGVEDFAIWLLCFNLSDVNRLKIEKACALKDPIQVIIHFSWFSELDTSPKKYVETQKETSKQKFAEFLAKEMKHTKFRLSSGDLKEKGDILKEIQLTTKELERAKVVKSSYHNEWFAYITCLNTLRKKLNKTALDWIKDCDLSNRIDGHPNVSERLKLAAIMMKVATNPSLRNIYPQFKTKDPVLKACLMGCECEGVDARSLNLHLIEKGLMGKSLIKGDSRDRMHEEVRKILLEML